MVQRWKISIISYLKASLTWLCQSIADIWPLTTLLLGLSIVFSCFLASKWAIMKPIEVENVGVVNIFGKKFSWTTKNWKNSFLSYKCNFHILCISDFFKFFYHKKVETLRFSNMYDTYRCPSSMWMFSFGEGMEKSENGQC